MIAAVILAAGESRRLGRPKQLVRHRGKTLLRHVVDCARGGGCDPVIVVLGARAEKMRTELGGLEIETVTNDDWREGVGSSVRTGVRVLVDRFPETRAVLLLACDQPRLESKIVQGMRERLAAGDARVIACEYAGTVGVPALFDRSLFDELVALSGTLGAKPLLERHATELERFPWADGVVDVDRPEDLDRFD